MLSRIESADSRIHTLLGFALSTTLGVATLGRAIRASISLTSIWFLAALGLALAIVVIGALARLRGAVALVNPGKLYQHSLHLAPWRFHADSIHAAGEHFEHNKALVRRKARAVAWMTGLFICELVCVLVWLTRA